MSKPLTLWNRFRLFYYFLKQVKAAPNGVYVDCSVCQSQNIKFKNQSKISSDQTVIYKSTYICMDCGATCDNTQVWHKNGNKTVPPAPSTKQNK